MPICTIHTENAILLLYVVSNHALLFTQEHWITEHFLYSCSKQKAQIWHNFHYLTVLYIFTEIFFT